MDNYLPQTATEYIECFRLLAALTNKAMDNIDNKMDWVSDNDRDKMLSRLAEAVETLSLLRGDSSIFIELRPEGLDEYQKEMYSTEDTLRNHLLKLGFKYPKQ